MIFSDAEAERWLTVANTAGIFVVVVVGGIIKTFTDADVKKVRADAAAAVAKVTTDCAAQVAKVQSDCAAAIEKVRTDSAAERVQITTDYDKRIAKLEAEQALVTSKSTASISQVVELQGVIVELKAEIRTLKQEIADLKAVKSIDAGTK